MIIINLMGGLGNQMYQYATAKHLSIINDTELKIDASSFRKLTSNNEHTFQLTSFNISAKQASRPEIWKIIQPTNPLARAAGKLFVRSTPHDQTNDIFNELTE